MDELEELISQYCDNEVGVTKVAKVMHRLVLSGELSESKLASYIGTMTNVRLIQGRAQ